jgi:flagellar biosynthetic protein FliS
VFQIKMLGGITMSVNLSAYNQYKQNSVFTSTPEELTLMLYNGLIKFIMQAQAQTVQEPKWVCKLVQITVR